MIRISEKLRQQVAKNADYRCEYCLTPEFFLATTFHIDHIRSIKHGGKTISENLAYACPHYNQNKGSDIASYTDEDELVRLFNPRKDSWNEHFEIIKSGVITPISSIGEVTVNILSFNQIERIIFRKSLIEIGVIHS
jgi:hypothetical protein